MGSGRSSGIFREQSKACIHSLSSYSALQLQYTEFAMKTTNLPPLRVSSDFIARGLASGRRAKQTGKYIAVDVVLDRLCKHLAAARKRMKAISHG